MKFLAPPSLFVALGVVSILVSGCSRDPEVVKREHFEKGKLASKQQKYRAAIVEYRAAIKADAKFGEARFKLAEAYLELGDERNAYRESVRAADLLPDDADAQILAVKMLVRAARYTDAKTRVDHVLANDPKNVNAQILRGNALAGLKEFDQAMAEIQRAIELDPKNEFAYVNLATLRAATGDRQAAEAIFQKAVEVAPKSVDALLALANYYRTMQRLSDAEAMLKRALALDPDQLVANRALAVFYMGAKRQPEAEPYLKKIVALTKDAASRMTLADYYIAAGRAPEARALLEVLANEKDSFAEATTRLASMELSAGSRAKAMQTVEKVLAKEPGNATALAMKSRLLLADRKVDEALAQAQVAVKSGPQFPEAQYAAGLAYFAKQDNTRAQTAFREVLRLNPSAVPPQVALAKMYLRQNRIDDAAKITREALIIHPDDVVLHLTLVHILTLQGDLPRATAELQPLLEQFPTNADVHTRAGMLAIAKNDRVAARQSLEKAVALSPDASEAFAGVIALDLGDRQAGAARTKIAARIKARPDDSALWLLNAAVATTLNDKPGIEGALKKAIEVDASNLDAYTMLSQFYIREKKLDQARAEFEKIVKQQPAAVGAATMIGVILEVQGKNAEARTQYEHIIATDPTAAIAANNLAWMYAEEEVNLDVAVQLAQTAMSRLPNTPHVSDTAGWVYFKAGLVTQALPLLERSVKEAPANAEFAYHLGLATLQVGEWDKARELLQRALKLNPKLPAAENARKALRSIEG